MKFEAIKEHGSNYPSPMTLLKGQVAIVGERYDGPEKWNGWVYCRTTCETQEGWVYQGQGRHGADTG